MIRKQILAFLALVALAALPAAASAQSPWGCYGGLDGINGWNYGYGYNYGVGYVPPPPYFSLFPPVYYSGQIVRRPYGSSPFAYPSTYERTPVQQPLVPFTFDRQAPGGQAKAPDPMVVMNPFVTGAEQAVAAGSTPPAKIDNPFVAINR